MHRFVRAFFHAVAVTWLVSSALSISIPAISTQAQAAPSVGWTDWQEAHESFAAGRLEDALRALRARPKLDDPNYFYNLGTIHQRLGQFGFAVAYLEKATRMRAYDSDIDQNLALARRSLGRLIGEARLDPASSRLELLADQIPLEETRALLGMIALLLSLLWIRAYSRRRHLKVAFFQPAALVVLVIFAVTAALFSARQLAGRTPPVVCLEQVVVRSGPGAQFAEMSRVETGTKLRLLGRSGSEESSDGAGDLWHQVRYSREEIGWVKASSLLLL